MSLMNAMQITSWLATIYDELEEAINKVEAAELDAADKRATFDLAYAKAFLNADGPMDIRKYKAVVETMNLRITADVADAAVKTLVRRYRAVDKKVDSARTAASAHKTELNALQMGGTP